MSTITKQMTVETQPAFGMPVYGRASVAVCGISVTRDHSALVKGAFPGTHAWRPPS